MKFDKLWGGWRWISYPERLDKRSHRFFSLKCHSRCKSQLSLAGFLYFPLEHDKRTQCPLIAQPLSSFRVFTFRFEPSPIRSDAPRLVHLIPLRLSRGFFLACFISENAVFCWWTWGAVGDVSSRFSEKEKKVKYCLDARRGATLKKLKVY